MAIQKPDWFKIDAAKFLSDAQVDAMTTLELGACLRLLCRQWLDGSIPDDQHLLSRLCRLTAVEMEVAWQALKTFFPVVEAGKRANRYMWIERDKVIADLERRSDEGTRAARKRWDDVRNKPNARPNGLPMPNPLGDPMQEQSRVEQSRADAEPNGSPIKTDHPETAERNSRKGLNATEVATALCSKNAWSGPRMVWAMKDAIEFQAKQMPEASLEQVGEWLVKAYRDYQKAQGKFAVGVQKFFDEGRYQSSPQSADADEYFKGRIFTDNPATRALAQMEAD